MRRGQHADVDLDCGSLVPSGSIVPSCKHAQQLGLRQRRNLADLVEEQRAAVRRLEAALAPLDGAGEGAGLVPEQLGLEQRLGERGAVDGHEGAVAPRAAARGAAGHQLLAGAGLAGDQHGRVALRDGVDASRGAGRWRRRADDPCRSPCREARRARSRALAPVVRRCSIATHPLHDLVEIERLGEIVLGTSLERATACRTSPKPVIRMTSSDGCAARTKRKSSIPSIFGMRTSLMERSKRSLFSDRRLRSRPSPPRSDARESGALRRR